MAEERRRADELIHEMHGDVKVLCTKVEGLERCVVTGNGGKSLLQRVARLEKGWSVLTGAWSATVLGVGAWLKWGTK